MQNDETQEVNLEETQTDESNQDESTEEDTSTDESTEESSQDDTDWEAEAKKWKAIAERNKKKNINKPKSNKSEDENDLRKDVETLKLSEQKRQFGYEHGLSPEETDKIFSITSNPTKETLEDPFVKAGIEAIRKTKKLESNTPSSNSKSVQLDRKKMSEMSPAEQNKAWQEHLRSKGVNV